ncbi:hypothetical protein BH23ACT2_BH23ACT2_02250 [soil metagenome]
MSPAGGVGGAASRAQMLALAYQKAQVALQNPATQAQIAKAKAKLQDPAVREQVAAQGRAAADRAKVWRDNLTEAETARSDAGPSRFNRAVSEQFGHGRVEKRIATLRATVETLGGAGPRMAGALAPVNEWLDEIEVSLEIASAMPATKRPKAYARLEAKLDELEAELFEASLPGGPPGAEDSGRAEPDPDH